MLTTKNWTLILPTGILLVIGATSPALAGQFSHFRLFTDGSQPWAIATGDYNEDGRSDLAVVNYTGKSLSVMLAGADGSFDSHLDYATELNPITVDAADLNGDGHLDLVVGSTLNDGLDDGSVGVMLGNGDGTFQPMVSYDAGANVTSVAVGDFNEDGHLDVVLAYSVVVPAGSWVSTYLGNGDGTLQPRTDTPVGRGSATVSVGDLDSDGHLDVAVVDPDISNADNGVNLLFGNGDGTWQPVVHIRTGTVPTSAAIADFNHDGNPDLVVTVGGPGSAGHHASVFLGNGDGTFQKAVNYDTAIHPNSVAVADFDGDGDIDMVVADWFSRVVSVFIGNGDGTFQPGTGYSIGPGPYFVAVGDFNGDGRPDVVTANERNYGGTTVGVILNTGTR